MRTIDRKLFRDLWGVRGQALAICSVIACGVAAFVMALSTLESLERAQNSYYQRYRFADVFANLRRAPLSLARRVAELPGVSQVQARIVVDVTLDLPDLPEPATGRLISIPDHPHAMMNDLHIRAGRYIDPSAPGEVLVGESFAAVHGLVPGDQVVAIINGRKQALKVAGIAISPEYILQFRPGELLPDEKRFGVFWMGYRQLAAAYNMEGAINDLTVRLLRGASQEEAIRRIDLLTEPYGGIGAFGREQQASHRYLSDEIRQLRTMGVLAPSIFMAVAAFLLNMVLRRLVGVQREQIAALKAFGYSHRQVGAHYLKFALLIAAFGGLLGIGLGAWMGSALTRMYSRFYRFPVGAYHLGLQVPLAAFAISVAAAGLGAVAVVRKAMALPPAEGLRPEAPAQFGPTWFERMGLGGWISPAANMVVRQLQRHPVKAAFSSLGVSLGVAVLILGSFSEDALEFIMYFQFQVAQRQDVMVTLLEPRDRRAMHEICRLPGVMHCETFRSVPARMVAGPRHKRVGITALEPQPELFRLVNTAAQPVVLPAGGLTLNEKLAEILHVIPGDWVDVHVLEGKRPVLRLPVRALVQEYGGLGAYMRLEDLQRALDEEGTLSGAFLQVAEEQRARLYRTLKNTPQVAGVNVKDAALQSFRETIAENINRIRLFNVLFASVIAFGVVYNNARIGLSERSRELATLRVIGFTRGEISAILLGELAVVVLAALPLGMGIGYAMAWWLTLGLDTELYRIPLVIRPQTYAFAGAVVLVAAVLSGLYVRRSLDHLDLVAVLKTRE